MDAASIHIGHNYPVSHPFIENLQRCGILARMFRIPFSLMLLLGAVCVPVQAATESARIERDHERARQAREHGRYVPLQQILDDAERRESGRVIEIELDEDDDEYEIELLRADGTVVELEYDARTGALLEREIEDD